MMGRTRSVVLGSWPVDIALRGATHSKRIYPALFLRFKTVKGGPRAAGGGFRGDGGRSDVRGPTTKGSSNPPLRDSNPPLRGGFDLSRPHFA